MRSCSRAGSNHLCGKHGSPDRKVGEVHGVAKMEHVTSDLKLIDRLWNDPTYGLDGFSTEGGYIQPIDRDQAVDGNGHANYDGYVLSREIEDDDSPVSELETYQFDADTMESYARKW